MKKWISHSRFTADSCQLVRITILILFLVLNFSFVLAQESPSPISKDSPASSDQRMVVRRGIRVDRKADLSATRHPVIELELRSQRLFDGKNQIHYLRIGSHTFTNV